MEVVQRWIAWAITVLVVVSWGAGSLVANTDPAAELDTRRLVGTAYYENDKFAEAAAEFRHCVELAPDSAVDRFNLGLVLMRATDYDAALGALAEARRLDAKLIGASYIEGIIHKRQGDYAKAVESLNRVIAADPACVGAHYNLGVSYKYMQQYDQAITAFGEAVKLAPEHPSSHYQLITLYRRIGDVNGAERHMEIFDRIKDTVDESEKTVEALERSKYSYILPAKRLGQDLPPAPDAKIRFVDVTEQSGLPKPGTITPALAQFRQSGIPSPVETDPAGLRDYYVPIEGSAVTLGDYDGDGDLDIYLVNCSTDPKHAANHLYQNDGKGKFTEVTDRAGVGDGGMGNDAIFGDYDNDGDNDLYVANCGPNVLYRNKGDGTFEDVSKAARVNEPQYGKKALFFDYDHDNDLDIFVANYVDYASAKEGADRSGQSNALLRNNGDGTFSDVTDEAGLLVDFAQTRYALSADLDGDLDIDLVVSNRDKPSRLFLNARMGRFEPGSTHNPPFARSWLVLAEGDFNHNGYCDLLASTTVSSIIASVSIYTNSGVAEFAPSRLVTADWDTAQVMDFNNDGWNDLLAHDCAGFTSVRMFAGAGRNEFNDVSEGVGLGEAVADSLTRATGFAAGDLDADGDADIVVHTRDKGPYIFRNDGGNRRNWVDVRLMGKKVNRNGYGATVEIAAGGHYQKQTVRDGYVHFGIGELKSVDVVRVTWPNGVAQNVIRPPINKLLEITQYVKVSASCGFLYAHNGEGFELINEILGIGPLGVPMAPDVYFPLDHTELTKIDAEQMVAQNGFYELRLTEELREITYADQIVLRVVDHPAELELIPNEAFQHPAPEDKLYAVADHRPPTSAVDQDGADALSLVTRRDGSFPTFPLVEQYDGLAVPHSLTLDFGDLRGSKRIMLFLDGWIYWPDSSMSIAIFQDSRYAITPLKLEVSDAEGRWHTAIESVGLPTSKGIIVPVDLSDRFLCDDYRVRLSTTLCVYFDRIFVSTRDESDRCRVTELPVATADLHYRGFSRMTRDEFGFERFDYTNTSRTGSWSPPTGRFTRYGEVAELLGRVDDMYVIFGPGDELAMRFDARSLPEVPEGWTRDFVFFADGWVKDGDLNTKFSEAVTPLPFHGMSGYPYRPDEHYPDTPAHHGYQKTYNTRSAADTVGDLRPLTSP